jgi:hypothetical protein
MCERSILYFQLSLLMKGKGAQVKGKQVLDVIGRLLTVENVN